MTKNEEQMLREYAAGRACTQSVIAALGPMSLWSKSAFDAEIKKAVDAEREECAKVCDELSKKHSWEGCYANECAEAIRSRGNT